MGISLSHAAMCYFQDLQFLCFSSGFNHPLLTRVLRYKKKNKVISVASNKNATPLLPTPTEEVGTSTGKTPSSDSVLLYYSDV